MYDELDRLAEVLTPHGFRTYRRTSRQLYHETSDTLVTMNADEVEVLWGRSPRMVVSLPYSGPGRAAALAATAAMVLALVDHLQTAKV